MTEPHTVKFVLERDTVRAEFTCTAPVDADCRRGCAVECHAWSDGAACTHDTTDRGRCLLVEWLFESGTELESYTGPKRDALPSPVELEWNGEYVEWRYPS